MLLWLEGKNHLEDLPIDVRVILKCTRKWEGDMDWIDLVQDSDRWRALVKAVMNIRVP
jgi:hypothetical protein